MKKGKFGLSTSAIAVIAFGFCALRQPQSVLLVTGFALLAEKDEWLNRQVMQALLLTMAYFIPVLLADWVFGGLGRVLEFLNVYSGQGILMAVNSFVGSIVYIALIALSILAVIRVIEGKDAGLPFISKLADGDFESKMKKSPPVYTPPVQPVTRPIVPAAQPIASVVPVVETVVVPVAQPVVEPIILPDSKVTAPKDDVAVRKCSFCGKDLPEDSRFCTECGAKTE